MALDKQKILNELESVVNQLQNANCGCLGNVFNNQHFPNNQQQNMVGYNAPHSCSHNFHGGACTHGSNGPVVTGSCGEPCLNSQMPGKCIQNPHQPNFGNAARNHFDPALVQPIVKDVYDELKSMTPENTIINSPIANQMGLPFAKDQHNMPIPCNAVNMPDMQKNMENSKAMQAMGNKFMNAVNMNKITPNNEFVNTPANASNLLPSPAMYNVMQCQNCRTTAPPVQQITNNGLDQGLNNNSMLANPQQILQNQSQYGQHAQGMAKFQELFPGVMGNGDLGFDPMAVAIKMNPDNQQNSQVPMGVAQNNMNNPNQASNAFTCAHLKAAPPQLNAVQNPVNAHSINMPMANSNAPLLGAPIQDSSKVIQNQSSNNGLYPNEQQIYQVSPRHRMTQDKVATDHNNQSIHRPFHPATEMVLNEGLPASQSTPKPTICEHVHALAPISQKQPSGQIYDYNTLGQPVEILPAEIYHKPEQNLPQTLSPQPNNPNNLPVVPLKASVNKDYIVNNIATNKAPCLMANPMSYGTHSDGKLNVNVNEKTPNSFIERTVGDTALNSDKIQRPQGDLHAGDERDMTQPNAGAAEKLSPNADRKLRNGLQDIVYTSYPQSAKWSFHGNARKALQPGQRPV